MTFDGPFVNDPESMINTLMEWSNVNSGTYNLAGLEVMSNLLSEAFAPLDCERSVIPLPSMERIDVFGAPEKVNLGSMLRFTKRSEAPFKVLLMGHMDTVFDIHHPFQRAIRLSKHKIVGPGVADMKGGLIVMLEALKAFEKNPKCEHLGWEVLINPDEEIGSLGSAQYLMERAKEHQVGLLFEPAMDEKGTLAGERSGSGKFTIVVRGQAAHAGRDFASGVNAIYAMAKIIQKIEALNLKRDKVTLNVGNIAGGGAVNVVPDLAICRLDIRIHTLEDEAWIHDQFSKIISEANQQPKITVEISGLFTRKPKKVDGKTLKLYELVVDLAKGLGQNISWKPSGGCSDGNNFSEVGLPNVDSLGVCGGSIHSDQEYMMIDSLIPRIQLTTAILNHLCEHGM